MGLIINHATSRGSKILEFSNEQHKSEISSRTPKAINKLTATSILSKEQTINFFNWVGVSRATTLSLLLHLIIIFWSFEMSIIKTLSLSR